MTEGAVDEKSPAAAAGLKPGDIIIEINGVNVSRENHSQIVARIKASGDSTLFLVADKECRVRQLQLVLSFKCASLYLGLSRARRHSHHQLSAECHPFDF